MCIARKTFKVHWSMAARALQSLGVRAACGANMGARSIKIPLQVFKQDFAALLSQPLAWPIQRIRGAHWKSELLAAWMGLKFVHSLLHVFLFKVLYQVQADAMEEALKEVKVLVGTIAFMRKFLGGSSEWCRSFQNRRMDALLIDEVHEDAFLRLVGLIARAPQAVLFGDSRQEFGTITQHSSANQLEAE